MSLRDLPEMFLLRGIKFTYEAVRDWEAKLAPSLIDNRRRRRGGGSRVRGSWYVDETYIKVNGRWGIVTVTRVGGRGGDERELTSTDATAGATDATV